MIYNLPHEYEDEIVTWCRETFGQEGNSWGVWADGVTPIGNFLLYLHTPEVDTWFTVRFGHVLQFQSRIV